MKSKLREVLYVSVICLLLFLLLMSTYVESTLKEQMNNKGIEEIRLLGLITVGKCKTR